MQWLSIASLTQLFSPAAQDVDEDELERELEELEQEQLDKELLDVGPAAANVLPDVPTEDLPERAKEKEKEKKKGGFEWDSSGISIN